MIALQLDGAVLHSTSGAALRSQLAAERHQVLGASGKAHEHRDEAAAVIEDEADRLNDLIQNLLTASKLQAQREIKLDIIDVWLNEIVERVVERFSKQTTHHRFKTSFPVDFPMVQGDEVRSGVDLV